MQVAGDAVAVAGDAVAVAGDAVAVAGDAVAVAGDAVTVAGLCGCLIELLLCSTADCQCLLSEACRHGLTHKAALLFAECTRLEQYQGEQFQGESLSLLAEQKSEEVFEGASMVMLYMMLHEPIQ